MQNYTQEYTYDELGNINQMKSVGDWTRDYYYETVNNRLKNHDNQTDVYDAGGERVRKVVEKTGGIVEERFYIGGFEVYRKTVSGTLDYERETLKISEGRNTIAQLETKTVENGNTISSLKFPQFSSQIIDSWLSGILGLVL